MAVYFPTNQKFGPWAFNAEMIGVASPGPTEMYYYPQKATFDTLHEREWAYFSKTGTLTEGGLCDAFQKITTQIAAFGSSNPVPEIDDDADSPYRGLFRLKFTLA